MEIFKAHSRASDLAFREIQTPECSPHILDLPIVLEKSRLGNVRTSRGPAILGTEYTLSADGSLLTKRTAQVSTEWMTCGIPLHMDRRRGKKFLRLKFNSDNYNYIAGGTATDYAHRLGSNVWHDVYFDYTDPERTILKQGSKVLYDGPLKNSINIYVHTSVSQIWLETGRESDTVGTYGTSVPTGYTWY